MNAIKTETPAIKTETPAIKTETPASPNLILDSASLALSELTSNEKTRPILRRLYFRGGGEPPRCRVYATDGLLGAALDLPAQLDEGITFDMAADDARSLAKAAGKQPIVVDLDSRKADCGPVSMALPGADTIDVPGCLRGFMDRPEPATASVTLSVALLHKLLTTAKKLGIASLRVELRAGPEPVLFSGLANAKSQDPRKFDAVLMPAGEENGATETPS